MSCFTTGTLIATDNGEVAVEKLRPGDLILTRDHGLRALRWIGMRRLSGRFLLDNPHLRPILVRKGAFGGGMPERDTMISPNNRLPLSDTQAGFLSRRKEEMVPIKNLIDHRGVQQIDTLGITYVHLMFHRHQVVAANGFWAECFKTGDYSLNAIGNSQRNEVFEIFPELQASQARKAVRPDVQNTNGVGLRRKFDNWLSDSMLKN